MSDLGNAAQARAIADQVADAAVARFAQAYPAAFNPGTAESIIPPPLKWAATIVGGVFTATAVAMAIWMASTLSELQQTAARMDERQQSIAKAIDGASQAQSNKDAEQDRRIGALETGQRGGGRT